MDEPIALLSLVSIVRTYNDHLLLRTMMTGVSESSKMEEGMHREMSQTLKRKGLGGYFSFLVWALTS